MTQPPFKSSPRSFPTLLWDLLPTLCLVVAIIVPPFAGTLAFYRTAVFLLIAHTAISISVAPRKIPRPLLVTLGLGGAFTAWSLLSAIFGIDPGYSKGRWLSEHFFVFLFFCAIVLNPHRFKLAPVLWAGILSTLFIALGVMIDPFASGELLPPSADYAKLWKVAYMKGFSSDITWITSHLILVEWFGMVAFLVNSPRRPLFWGGILSTVASLWVVTQTFQVMVFFVVFVSLFVFVSLWVWKMHGRRGVWAIVLLLAVLIGGFAYRDLVLYPEKKTFEGIQQLLSTGKTENLHIQSRLNGIAWALKKCHERPLLGWGPGREILRKVDPHVFDVTEEEVLKNLATHPPIGHLHNQFADLLIRIGIPGLLAYILFLASILIQDIRSRPWRADWLKNPGAGLQLGAFIATFFALVRLMTETYPASSVGLQYWMVLAFAVIAPNSWDNSPLIEAFRSPSNPRN